MVNTVRDIQVGYKKYKDNYPALFWGAFVLLPIALISLAIQLNVRGYRFWDMIIGIILGLAAIYPLTKLAVVGGVFSAGVAGKLLDGKPDNLKEVAVGGMDTMRQFYKLVLYLFVLLQTIFTGLSLKRFESAGSAYVAAFSLVMFALVFYLVVQTGKRFSQFLLIFWAVLAVYSMGMAWFMPSYFEDDVTYEMRHAKMRAEADADAARAAVLTEKVRSGEKLTMEEEVEWGDIEQRQAERSLPETLRSHIEPFVGDWTITNLRPYLIKEIRVPEGWYRATVSAGAIPVGQGSYELEGRILINGKPSGERIYIGANQSAKMTYTFAGPMAGSDLEVARSVHITFTPAP